jgi:GTP-binding protein EngB required for normal cell division
MDLKTYEQVKFELAELIRSGQLILSEPETDSNKRYEAERPWRDLLTRLAEDRFTVVVAGRFSRGKSSLMNAVLGLDRLPTGIVPLTSVITYVRYGTSERVLLNYERTRLRGEATLQELPNYVTERGNPGNVKRIHSAEIQLPAEILRRGFFFVDTPGLGSAIFENTQTTERFIPEIDVLILVTSYESPLTEDEMRFLHYASTSVRAVFIVINKQDTVAKGEREEVLRYVEETARTVLGDKVSKPFSVSARDGLAAKQSGNVESLGQSGILDFEEALIQFLTNERSRLFLSAMCERVLAELRSLPDQQSDSLFSKLQTLQQQIDPSLPSANQRKQSTDATIFANPGAEFQRIATCEVCNAVMKEQMNFLSRYQYDLSTQPKVQQEHARNGGFCPLHTWHYEQIASPRGVCTAYPVLLKRIAEHLRFLATSGSTASSATLLDTHCQACAIRWATEDQIIDSILGRAGQVKNPDRLSLSAVCLPHLQLILQRTEDESLRQHLLSREAELMERFAEDMQRYAIKHDALRRDLASKEEQNAPLRALQLLIGHRNVNAIFTVRDIL